MSFEKRKLNINVSDEHEEKRSKYACQFLLNSKDLKIAPRDIKRDLIRETQCKVNTNDYLRCQHKTIKYHCKICDPKGYNIQRIRSCVNMGLKRVGAVKDM